MSDVSPVTYSQDEDGVGWLVFADPAGRANVLNAAVQAALAAALSAASERAPKALIVASGLERIFIAGADLAWLSALPDSATAAAFARAGQALFQRLAEFPVPVVAAIHGACVGGGFELALACDWRIASDSAVTRIGLPETGIGTIPGWGGCARLPRVIGAQRALDHILRAQLLPGADALQAGLVDELVPAAELRARARAAALRLAGTGRPRRDPPPPGREFFEELRATTAAKTRGQLPAPSAAIAAVERGWARPLADALEIEARLFGEVTSGETCKNLVRVFLLRESARKRTLAGWFARPDAPSAARGPRAPAEVMSAARPIQRVGIVGAGVMGSGIAQWLAQQGCDVVLRDVDTAALGRGREVIRGLFDDAVKRGRLAADQAEAAARRIATTTGWEGFVACDAVIEAIVEDVGAKRRLFAELAAIVPRETVLASNTSALPIEEIAAGVVAPERVLGLHFFNPVSRMPLLELVLGAQTSEGTAARALTWVKALGKLPLICRSSPGFLVTRVLFFYLNAAVRAWELGRSTQTIDAALRDYGWPMGPLRLIDEVGVDVTDFIFGEMAHYFPGRFEPTTACGALLAAGLKGRKNGAGRGFYRYAGGKEIVNDGETQSLLPARTPEASREDGQEHAAITDRLMRVMVEEAELCLAEGVVKSRDDIDFALLSGAGFPAFRGGLLRWADVRSTAP